MKVKLVYIFNIIMYIVLIGIVVMLIIGYVDKFQQKYPNTRLKLSGQMDYIASTAIEAALADLLKNNLWIVNVDQVKDRVYANPWVNFVFVNKHWPDILQVEIVQHSPIAKWNDKFFLTSTGKVLCSNEQNYDSVKNLNLPLFYGNVGQENLLINTYLMLLEKLAHLGLFISKIEFIEVQGIQVQLSNKVTLKLGTFDLPDRINRFIIAYKKKLQSNIIDIDYVDLRYTNGIAVAWISRDEILE